MIISEQQRRELDAYISLYQREELSRTYYPKQAPGIVLSQSGYFPESLSDDSSVTGCLNEDKNDWNDTIKDIDRQICKGLSSELCDPESIHGEDLTDKQRMDAINELRKPLKYEKTKSGNITIGA